RSERLIVKLLLPDEEHDHLIIKYINRLSDYLFVLGRYVALKLNVEEQQWHPRV
ncbi:MAG: ATP:cob(I)alamin adenosyltransferase, partial [Chitinophagaceae bacterium]